MRGVDNMKKILSILLLFFYLLTLISATVYAYDADDPSTYYIANKETGKFHLPNCSYLPNEYNSYLVDVHNTAKLKRLSPCGHCDPLNNEIKSSASAPQSKDTPSNSIPAIIIFSIIIGTSAIAIFSIIRKRKEP